MKHLRLLLHGFVLMAAFSCLSSESSQFYLKDGDRVVFYGDSITEQRLYTTFVETYAVTRFPKMKMQFVHAGVGGDRVGGGWGGPIDTRLERDVFAYNPTVMTIMLGMNDASYTNFNQKIFDQYTKGYEHIVASVKQHVPNIRLTLIQPSPYDDVTRPPFFEGGYNQVLVRYGEFVKELANRNGATVADLNAPVVAALEKAWATDTNVAKQIIGDRIHPGAAGHLLMASELLKAWHAPALVSEVEIDASGKTPSRGAGTHLSNVKTGKKVSWTQTDAALPMPIATNDAVMALAVRSSDVVDALDQQIVKVTGLEGDFYTLTIDGGAVHTFSRQQLEQGVNLALLPTPMFKQAAEVHKLTIEHNNLHFARWRNIQIPMHDYKGPKVLAAMKSLLKALDEEEAAAVQKQRQTAQPRPHDFGLIQVSKLK